MCVASTGMTMMPDQVMAAIHFAEFVMAKEKKDRLGSSKAVVSSFRCVNYLRLPSFRSCAFGRGALLLVLFHFSLFLRSKLGLFMLFSFAFIFFSLITHICFSLLEPRFPR